MPSSRTFDRAIARTRGSEHGFGLLELIIVITMITIIMAIAVPSLTRTKQNSSRSQMVSVARDYAAAVEKFREERGGRVPDLGGVDWPTGAGADKQGLRGPVDAERQCKNTAGVAVRCWYMKEIPEAMADGRFGLYSGATLVTPGVQGSISYETFLGATPRRMQYLITVKPAAGSTWAGCWLGNAPPTASPLQPC